MLKDLLHKNPSILKSIRHGLEKECLRVNTLGEIAQTFHPDELGKKLTHPSITTDYAENLLEFITGVHQFSTDELLNELKEIQDYTTYVLSGDELLWPSSMPAILPEKDSDIPIADYGPSNVGMLKSVYREGLGHRYGRSMQSIAGVHYNFSFDDDFWTLLKNEEGSTEDLKAYKSRKYFHLIRNFKRYSWLLVYLFGASPVVDASFLNGKEHSLDESSDRSFSNPHATSLRMGGLGYTSKAQDDIKICFNHLDSYIETIEEARLQSVKEYEEIGLKEGDKYKQLNTNLLQIDNEFYSVIRPKNVAKSKQSSLQALDENGIEYIEVRLIDLDPSAPYGISKERIQFLHIFLTACLFEDSQELTTAEYIELHENFNLAVTQGRKEGLKLKKAGEEISLEDFAHELFEWIKPYQLLFSSIDSNYEKAFNEELLKIQNKDNLPASKVLVGSNSHSFINFNLDQIKGFQTEKTLNANVQEKFEKLAKTSCEELAKLESSDQMPFDHFLIEYFENIKI